MKYPTLFFSKLGKILQNLSSAAVVIGALRVRKSCFHHHLPIDFYAPAMIMVGALSITPVRPYFMYVRPHDVRSLNRILLIRIL